LVSQTGGFCDNWEKRAIMKLVIDNNIFFSLMKPESVNSYIYFLANAQFYAPKYIETELEEHKVECIAKAGLSEHEFEIRQKEVKENIEFFEFTEYKQYLKESIILLPDWEDAPYLALAQFLNASIWSNDIHFMQQSKIKVFTTQRLFDMLLKREI